MNIHKNISINSTYWKWVGVYILVLMGYIFVLSAYNYTVAPTWIYAQKGYLPWKIQYPDVEKRFDWDYKRYHYGGDQIVAFNTIYINALNQTDTIGPIDYSTQIGLGFPISVTTQITKGFTLILSQYLNNTFLKQKDYVRSLYISLNIVFFFWASIAAVLLFMIAQKLLGNNYLSLITSFAANPIFHRNSEESWLMIYVGGLLFTLGIIYFLKANKFNIKSFIFIVFSIVITLRAQFYSYILYIPVVTLFILPFIFYKGGLRSLLYFISSIGIGYLIQIESFSNILYFLSNSSSDLSFLKLWQGVHAMEYSVIPIKAIFDLPLLDQLISTLNISWPWTNIFQGSAIYIGLPVLLFTIIGILRIKDKSLIFFLLMLLFYQLGPVQLLFRLIFKGPFLNETSVKMSTYLIPIAIMMSSYVLKNVDLEKHKKWLTKAALFFLIFGIIQIIEVFILNVKLGEAYIWTEGFSAIIPIIGLLLYLKHPKKELKNLYITMMIMVIPLYNGISPVGRASFYPSKIQYAKLGENFDNFHANPEDVAAIVINEKRNNWTKRPIHSNFWYSFPVRSINAYISPLGNNISLLHWYQHFTNIIAEDASKEFIIDNLKTLSLYRHRHHLMATYIYDDHFTIETSRYFDLIGVNLLALKSDQILRDQTWVQNLKSDGIQILKRKRPFDPIRTIKKIEYIEDDLERIQRILNDKNFDLRSTIVTDIEESTRLPNSNNLDLLNYSFTGQGKVIIRTNGQPGIITTNIIYDPLIKVYNTDTMSQINKFKCNYAFLCFSPNSMDSTIVIEPKLLDYNKSFSFILNKLAGE